MDTTDLNYHPVRTNSAPSLALKQLAFEPTGWFISDFVTAGHAHYRLLIVIMNSG